MLRNDIVARLFTGRASDVAREVAGQVKHGKEVGKGDVLTRRRLDVV